MARIDKHVAAALTQGLPTRTDTRSNLRGIKLDADGTTVATDGHLLLTAPPSTAAAGDYPVRPPGVQRDLTDVDGAVTAILPREVLDAARTVIRRTSLSIYDQIVVTAGENGHCRITSADGTGVVSDTQIDASDDDYPAWKKVLPTGPVTVRVTLGADLLIRIAKAAKALDGKTPRVTMEFRHDGDDPTYLNAVGLRLASDYSDPVTGALMPMRD